MIKVSGAGRFAKASIETFAGRTFFPLVVEATSRSDGHHELHATDCLWPIAEFRLPPISITDATLTPPPPSLSEDEAAATATSNSIG